MSRACAPETPTTGASTGRFFAASIPGHPDLPALPLLTDTLRSSPPLPATCPSPADVPDEGTGAEVVRTLLELVPLERQGLSPELIAHRRALQRLGPELSACYMETLGGRLSTAPTRRSIAE